MDILKNYQFIDSESSLVIGIFEEDNSVLIDQKMDEKINTLIDKKLIKKELGSINKIYTFQAIDQAVIYLIGLGKKSEFDIKKLEIALRSVNRKMDAKITLFLDSFKGNLDIKEVVQTIILTTSFYDYVYDECKSKKEEKTCELSIFTHEQIDEIVDENFALATAIGNTRDLVNKPYNYLNAQDLVAYAKGLVESLNNDKVSIKIFEKEAISNLGMNAFLGVNKGSTEGPKLIHITYQGKKEFNDPVALIGKGIMFDTGGYSIKENMVNMKDDMGGAATVLGVLEACAKNQLPINLQIIICATDNRINGEALLPDDVLTAMNQKTIEIVSTDAEGRLTLADALCYAQKEGSKKLIDIATLTGAVVVALGDYTTGIFGNNQAMIQGIIKSGDNMNEHVWELPITDYIREKVRSSKVADLTNSTGRAMGASGAAAFLEEFVEKDSQWVHLDIAGTVFHTAPAYQEWYGASGVMVKTLYHFLKTQS